MYNKSFFLKCRFASSLKVRVRLVGIQRSIIIGGLANGKFVSDLLVVDQIEKVDEDEQDDHDEYTDEVDDRKGERKRLDIVAVHKRIEHGDEAAGEGDDTDHHVVHVDPLLHVAVETRLDRAHADAEQNDRRPEHRHASTAADQDVRQDHQREVGQQDKCGRQFGGDEYEAETRERQYA